MSDETQADFKIGEEQSDRRAYLFDIGWDILDLLPAERAYELRKQLVEEIIDNLWDNGGK